MLIKIDPILSPEVLHTLRAMGHGDRLILCDSNFPAYSMNSRVHRIDGVNAARAAEAILSVFPLDSFVDSPIQRMEIVGLMVFDCYLKHANSSNHACLIC